MWKTHRENLTELHTHTHTHSLTCMYVHRVTAWPGLLCLLSVSSLISLSESKPSTWFRCLSCGPVPAGPGPVSEPRFASAAVNAVDVNSLSSHGTSNNNNTAATAAAAVTEVRANTLTQRQRFGFYCCCCCKLRLNTSGTPQGMMDRLKLHCTADAHADIPAYSDIRSPHLPPYPSGPHQKGTGGSGFLTITYLNDF